MNASLFTKYLDQAVEQAQLPGISASLSIAGKIEFLGGRGFSDFEKTIPANENTVYPIASVTKTMTAHLLLRALKESGHSPDTRIKDLEPRFRLNHPHAGETLTAEQLIHHFGPLPPHLLAWQYHDTDRETFLFERLPHLACHPDPTPKYRYSNILYALGGWIAGQLMDSTWEESIEREIFSPLQMTQTTFLDDTWAARTHLAQPHRIEKNNVVPAAYAPGEKEHIIAPASEIMSCAADLHRWAEYSLAHSLYHALPERSKGLDEKSYTVSSGWRVHREEKEVVYWHSGQCTGYTSLLFIIPSRALTCVLLTNRDEAVETLQAIKTAVTRTANQLTLPDIITTSTPFSLNDKKAHTPVFLEKEGAYWNPGYGRLDLSHPSETETTLTLQGKIHGSVIQSETHHLVWQLNDSLKRFNLNKLDHVTDTISLQLTPHLAPAPFIVMK